MLRSLTLTAALLASLAMPSLAQTGATASHPATRPTAARAAPAPAPAAATPATRSTSLVKKIDVNGASEQDLASLPGIGPVTAKNIVQGRPWDDLKDLVAKKAVNQPTFDRNKDSLALANINTSSAADMARTLPGIGEKTAPKIVNGRPYATPQDLVAKKAITQHQFDRIKDVITY